jgi:hypothetical protein
MNHIKDKENETMYTSGRKFAFQLLFVMCSAALAVAEKPAVTLPELRQIVTDSRESVTTAHLVYIEEFNSDEPPPSPFNKDPISHKIFQIQTHGRKRKVDTLLDRVGDRVKMSLTELRDIDKLLKEHNLPPEQKINVPKSRTILMQGDYDMEISDGNAPNRPMDMLLTVRPGRHNMFEFTSLGIIDEKLLSEDLGPTSSEINSDGKSLLRIELTTKGQNPLKRTVDCDPSLGYRFRRIQQHSDGKLIKETIADNYKDVNGIPYPFLHIERSFDKDGKIIRETKHVMEKVELGVDLSPDDFKIFVPAGTQFIDDISRAIHTIEQSGYMSIDDALSIGTKGPLKH